MDENKTMTIEEAMAKIAELQSQLDDADKKARQYSQWWCEEHDRSGRLIAENKELSTALTAMFNIFKNSRS